MSGLAAIDCGTNSIRLLVAYAVQADGDGAGDGAGEEVELIDLDRRMEIVRLGEGVDETGSFSPQALERTFTALRGYVEAIRAQGIEPGPETVRMAATSATRDAANRDAFVEGVREILGVEPEVITGQDEAELSFVGATVEFDAGDGTGDGAQDGTDQGRGAEPPFLVVDIGGGSTEFVLGGDPERDELIRASVSVDMGCVRMAERHLHGDPPTEEQIAAATADIEAALDEVERAVPLREAGTVVCVAGTATTVAGISLDLNEYDSERIHNTRVGAGELDRIAADLLRSTHEQRAAIGVMHPGRVDVIGAGALVLSRVVARTGADGFTASEHDILDGLAWSLVP